MIHDEICADSVPCSGMKFSIYFDINFKIGVLNLHYSRNRKSMPFKAFSVNTASYCESFVAYLKRLSRVFFLLFMKTVCPGSQIETDLIKDAVIYYSVDSSPQMTHFCLRMCCYVLLKHS